MENISDHPAQKQHHDTNPSLEDNDNDNDDDDEGTAKKETKNTKQIVLVGCGQIMTHHIEQMAGTGDDSFQVLAVCDPNPKRRSVILQCCQYHGLSTPSSSSSSSSSSFEFDTLTEFLQKHKSHTATSVNDSENNNDDMNDTTTTTTTTSKLIFVIAVPHYLHEPIALEALASGNHVVLEKPLAPTLKSCQALLDASIALRRSSSSSSPESNKMNNMLIVAEQSPFWEEIALAKTLVQRGEIGTILSAASYFYESMRCNLTSGMDENNGGLGWRCSLDKAGGGIVLDGGLHWIRPLRELCGDVERVVGVTRRNVQPEMEMEGETLAHAIFQMKAPSLSSGAAAAAAAIDGNGDKFKYSIQPPDSGPLFATFSCNALHSAPMANDSCPYFRITGTLGELVISGTGLNPNGGGGLKLYNEENINGKDMFPADRQGGFYLGFRGLWKEIGRILNEDDWAAAEKTVEDAGKDVAVALAIYESARSGQWVSL